MRKFFLVFVIMLRVWWPAKFGGDSTTGIFIGHGDGFQIFVRVDDGKIRRIYVSDIVKSEWVEVMADKSIKVY